MFFFFFSLHLLITLWTQLTQIKEKLQSWSRKLELKGFSLFLPLHCSSFLKTSLQTAQDAEYCTRQRLPKQGHSLFTFPFYCISLRQFSAECQGQVAVPKKKEERKKEKREKTNLTGSEALKGRCPRWEVIGMGTLSRWVSKATEKRSTFHPPLSCSQHTQLQYTVQLFTTTFFSSTWCKQQANIYFGRNEITYPEDEIYSLLSSS